MASRVSSPVEELHSLYQAFILTRLLSFKAKILRIQIPKRLSTWLCYKISSQQSFSSSGHLSLTSQAGIGCCGSSGNLGGRFTVGSFVWGGGFKTSSQHSLSSSDVSSFSVSQACNGGRGIFGNRGGRFTVGSFIWGGGILFLGFKTSSQHSLSSSGVSSFSVSQAGNGCRGIFGNRGGRFTVGSFIWGGGILF
ncbi:hypothetical protein CEXT_274871 [Caerostris extrusa]|uniref:Uncharacterized protein n=1 Tax=Caerostris extrusa TaxID=172846 RepID=A0AAV4UHM9_CAEEX|nr:hypothetical protein CEXT_274871 [Caerostris extrusa]